MTECCKALNYAHFLEHPETNEPLNIVHRDISPPNILLSKNGEVKLVDFGLAKANSQIESTDPGVVKGKFSYLSPEAASGLDVDHRADVFAVGIILWELLTGRRLFYGETDYQTVELVRQARVPSLAALNPQIEPELENIVRTALAKDPADRYQNAADLGDALAQYLFSRRMKVTSRDIAALVKDAQSETHRKRTSGQKESIIDALIQDEMQKMTSLFEDQSVEENSNQTVGSMSLDPKEFVDTSAWAGDFGIAQQPPPRIDTNKAPPLRPAKPGGDLDSLQQILEPDRTGVHKKSAPPPPSRLTLWLALVLVVAAAGGVGAFLMLR
jgi:serine/threonine-protein kinase